MTLATREISTTRSSSSSPRSSSRGPPRRLLRLSRRPILELQSAFARAVGNGLHATMVAIAPAVEHHEAQSLGLCAGGHGLAHQLGLLRLLFARHLRLEVRVDGRGRYQRIAGAVVNHLGVDVLQAAIDVQARALGRANNRRANTLVAAGTR